MKKYVIVLRGSVAMADWRCETQHPSDPMAKEYWARQLSVDPAAKQAMTADLFELVGEDSELVCHYKISSSTVVVPSI